MESEIEITLIGTPNVGKTSLFNYLTGEHNVVGNWDGVTLSLAQSNFNCCDKTIQINDLPGCYSLVSTSQMSLEEKLVCEYINNPTNKSQNNIFINLISTESLARDLYVTLQLLEQGCNIIIVLNMHNSIADNNYNKKYQELAINIQNILGCSVVSCNIITGFGIDKLKKMILQQSSCSSFNLQNNFLALKQYIALPMFENWQQHIVSGVFHSIGELIRFLEGDIVVNNLRQNINKPLLLDPSSCSKLQQWDVFLASRRHEFIKNNFTVNLDNMHKINLNKLAGHLDDIVLNKYFGLPIFGIVIYVMFFCVTQISNATENYFDSIINRFFIHPINIILTLFNIPNWLLTIFNDGIAVGVSTLFKFIPVLFVMHTFLFVLENSGYIARAVFLIDRSMRFLGLSGKSLIPMIIGFGCNVPAILGARVIEQKRDKIITILMTPFMSCNARLVTYSVFATAFFESNQGNIIFYLYIIGIIFAILTGFLLQNILSGSISNLIMELPSYSMPSLQLIFKKSVYKVKRFLIDSALIVICVCTVIAGLKNIDFANFDLLNCALFKYTMLIFKPIGIVENNWPAVAGLFSGLIAKEAIIGSLNSLYNTNNQEILKVLYINFGSYKAAFAYLLFVLLSFPCVSVIASIAKELNIRWAIFAMFWTTGLAYMVSVFYYQLATFNEHPIYSTTILLRILSVLVIVLLTIKIKINNIKIQDEKMIPILVVD